MRYLHFILIVLFATTAYGETLHVGPDQAFSRIEDAVSAAKPGATIIVHPPRPNGAVYEEVKLMIDKPNLTIQAANPNDPVVLDGDGVNYTGAGSTPRAIVQFCAHGSGGTLDGFILRNAHNETHNAAGVRISQANNVTISRCDIFNNDMGIMSDGCVAARASGRGYASEKAGFEDTHFHTGTDLVGRAGKQGVEPLGANQLITHCRITDNGAEEEPGYNHNLYLGGDSVKIQYSEIARAKTGHNVKCRVHRVTISNCSIHDAANREIDLVDGKDCTDVPGSNALISNCSIKKDPLCKGNRGCIHFGKDGGAAHDGALILNNNAIETPFSSPVIELTDGKDVVLFDNVFSDAGSGAPATLIKSHGNQKSIRAGNKIPDKWNLDNRQ